jgi:hypothetical protein
MAKCRFCLKPFTPGLKHPHQKWCSGTCRQRSFFHNYRVEHDQSYFQMQREKLKVAGLCLSCRKRPATNGVYCAGCHERHKKRGRDYWRSNRIAVLEHYGGSPPRCACSGCGESRYEFLSIDHINGGGRKHRQSLGMKTLYQWLIKNGFPDGFRVLCHNCNQSIGLYGYCPHQNKYVLLTP